MRIFTSSLPSPTFSVNGFRPAGSVSVALPSATGRSPSTGVPVSQSTTVSDFAPFLIEEHDRLARRGAALVVDALEIDLGVGAGRGRRSRVVATVWASVYPALEER
jgi:hypothetical protein